MLVFAPIILTIGALVYFGRRIVSVGGAGRKVSEGEEPQCKVGVVLLAGHIWCWPVNG